MKESNQIVQIFKALCDEKRVNIIKLLKSGEMCACVIAEKLEITQPKLSYHMKILCSSGLVEHWYVGKWTHYKLSDEGAKTAINVIEELMSLDGETSCSCSSNKCE